MLVRFLAKRTMVLAAAAAAVVFFADGCSPLVPAGILLGCAVALYKIRLNTLAIPAAGRGNARASLVPMLFQMLTLGLLVVTAFANVRIFAGFAGGLLLVPLFITANSITEAAGLSHNGWGGELHKE